MSVMIIIYKLINYVNHIISTKGIQQQTWLGGKGDPLEIMKDIEMVNVQSKICSMKWSALDINGFT